MAVLMDWTGCVTRGYACRARRLKTEKRISTRVEISLDHEVSWLEKPLGTVWLGVTGGWGEPWPQRGPGPSVSLPTSFLTAAQ